MSPTSATTAMIWKEVREGLKWAALALLFTTGAVVFVLWSHRGIGFNVTDYLHVGSPILTDDFQAVTIIGAGVTALLLSLAQTLPEKRLDQWAFLIHRPVSRTRLLLGKVIAGLVLYLLAVGLPMLGAVIWVATPGHVPAPFEPAMVLPSVADLLAGVMYYFAGMVVGLREARWYGSRILAIGLAVVGSFGVFIVPEFWHALLIIVGVTAVLATAAWGNFITGGNYDPQPRVAKVALGVAVFAGIVLFGGAAVGMLAGLLPTADGGYEYTDYRLSPSGKILRYTQRQAGNDAILTVTDAAGNPVSEFPEHPDAQTFHVALNSTPSASMWLQADPSISFVKNWYRRPERYYTIMRPATAPASTWYYLNGEGYVVGYDPRHASVVGYFTPDGFQPGPSEPVKRFAERPVGEMAFLNGTKLVFPSGIYQLDVNARRLIVSFTPPPGEQLLGVGTAYTTVRHDGQTGPYESKPVFDTYATTSKVYVQMPDGRPIFSTSLERPFNDYGILTVYRPQKLDRYFFWYSPVYNFSHSLTLPQHVVELSPSGEVLARHELPPVVRFAGSGNLAQAAMVGAAAPMPFGLAPLLLPVAMEGQTLKSSLKSQDTVLMLRASLVSGVLCGLITYAIGRRYALGRRALLGWTVGNVLLGPAGVLTMLSLRSWPARKVCPSCRKRRVVNRELCPTCAAPFPPPAMDGTEIFAT